MVKCKQCGNEFDEQYGVCPKCRTVYEAEEKLPEIKPPAETLPELKEYSDEKSAGKKKPKTKLFVIIGIVAAVVIIGIIAGIIIASSDKGGTSEFKEQISLGEMYLSEENYEEAIFAFKKAIEIDPNDPEGYIKLADAYLAKGDTQNAISALETGYERTGSEKIKTKLDKVRNGDFSEDSEPEEVSKEEYKDPEYTLGTIVASGNCGKDGGNATYQLDDKGLLVISGSGEMKNYTYNYNARSSDAPWFDKKESIKTVILKEGITSIGRSAFYRCDRLKSITIPDSVTSIGFMAFYNCNSLTGITIPDSVTSIGDSTFGSCKSLPSITIPNSVTSIGNYAFYDCTSLTSITIPDSVTTIGESAFWGCENLTSVTIPDSVTSIGALAFSDCKSLKEVIYYGTEENFKSIEMNASDWVKLTPLIKYEQKPEPAAVSQTQESTAADIATPVETAQSQSYNTAVIVLLSVLVGLFTVAIIAGIIIAVVVIKKKNKAGTNDSDPNTDNDSQQES